MKIIPVDPNEISDLYTRRRGRVSYPILKQFLESNIPVGLLDKTGIQQSSTSLYSSLGAYAKSHKLPVEVVNRQGQIYLLRLDMDADGTSIPDWKERLAQNTGQFRGGEVGDPKPITPDVVDERFGHEKDQVTK